MKAGNSKKRARLSHEPSMLIGIIRAVCVGHVVCVCACVCVSVSVYVSVYVCDLMMFH